MNAISHERPSEVAEALASLHESAFPEVEFGLDAFDDDAKSLLFVARAGSGTIIGFVAATASVTGQVDVWEHVVHPDHRQTGLGQRLLHAVAAAVDPETQLCLDPAGALDVERAGDYYGRFGVRRKAGSEHLWATAADARRLTSA